MTVPAEYLTQFAKQWRQFADTAREQFRLITRQKGLAPGELETEAQGPIAGWREIDGREAQVVAAYGRLFDLIVLGRTSGEPAVRWQETCEAALFETGRPVLLAAAKSLASLGDTIVVAWNGSTETARTVALAMPMLAAASRVIVMSVDSGMMPGPSGREMAQHLARSGIAAEAVTVKAGARTRQSSI